jgi:hypothetical protein
VQHVGVVDVGLAEVAQVVVLARDPDRLPQLGGALVDVAGHREREPERVARVTLDQRQARGGRGLERLARHADGGPEVGDEHASARQRRQQRRATRRIVDQLEPALERGDAVSCAVEVPLRACGRFEDRRGAPLVRLRAEARECRLEQRQLAARMPERGLGVGRPHEQRHAIDARQRLGIRHPVPQLERPFEQPRGLAVRVHELGGGRGAHRGGQRRLLIARRGEVMGDRGRDLRIPVLVEATLERLCERQVQRGPLAREQVVLDDLAQERMAELVGAVVLGDDDVRVDGLAQAVAQRPRLESARLLEQRMIDPLADRDQAQQLAGGLRQPLHTQHQRVAQRVRRGAAAVEPCRQQLLAEQRVAAGTAPQTLEQVGGGRRSEDVGQLLRELVAGEWRERDAPRPRVALELGHQRAQRVAAPQLVAAVGAHHQDPLVRQAPR